MLHNFFWITLRNLARNRGYAIINILGLSIGIAVCLLIFIVIRFETSFDSFHTKKDHIFRVVSVFQTDRGVQYEPGVPFPTASALRLEYPQLPGVASIVSLGGGGQISILDYTNDTRSLQKFKEEKGVLYAEPQFFDIFDFSLLAGNRGSSLKEANTALLTRSVAEKYFGSWQSAPGKLIKLDNAYTLRITGVLDDPPANTDFPLKVVISYATLKNTGLNARFADWTSIFAQHYCFVVLPDHLGASQFDKDLAGIVRKYKPAENRNEGMMLLPLKEMHFDTRYSTFNQSAFSRELILGLSIIGLFVLVIACVNFINLATAQAINRSKEVGIRKVLGSTRRQLLSQFLNEAMLLICVATLIAVAFCELTIPFFNRVLGTALGHGFIADPVVVGALFLIVLATTLLAGFYPAVVLSRFNPVTAFKNQVGVSYAGAPSIRRALVVLQFTIAQVMIISVFIIIGQMDYFRSSPLGFQRESIVVTHIPGDSTGNAKIESLRDRLQQMAGVDGVSFSFASPIDDNNWNSDIAFNNVKKKDFGANLKWADANYPATYGLTLLAGQFYGQSDTVKDLVVNEAFLKKLGIRDPENAIGSKIDIPGENKSGTLTGVVKDFNIASLHDAIAPVIMGTWKETYQTVNIKVQASKVKQVLTGIEQLWKESFPDEVYEYRFLDERIAGYYKQEEQMSLLYKIFAGIAIFLSCIGLYSLASFMAVQRTKEVAIRKTLGATVANVVYLFSKEFFMLVLVAFFLSSPIAWYFMHQWLQNYAFHIEPGPGVFMLAVSISLVIAWLSVGYKAFTAAVANPVKSLKAD